MKITGIVQTQVRIILALLLFLSFFSIQAQESGSKQKKRGAGSDASVKEKPQADDYFKDDFLRYEDFVYRESIRTVLMHREGWELTPPIILYNSDERLLDRKSVV